MKKIKDPFDPSRRFPIKRRKKDDIKVENEKKRKQYEDDIIENFEWFLEIFDRPEYIASDNLIKTIVEEHENPSSKNVLLYFCEWAMNRLKYAKIINQNSADGRWKICGSKFFLYAREDLVEGGITLAKQRVEWLNARQYRRAIGSEEPVITL